MKLPWYTHKDFELRINTEYNDKDYRIEYFVEQRFPSKIPFVKWAKWELCDDFLPNTTFDKALDYMNKLKNSLLNREKKKNVITKDIQKKAEWEKITL